MKTNSIADIMPYVKKVELFRYLTDSQIERLFRNCIIKHCKKNDTVFYQSDTSTDLYIILQGAVKAMLIDKDCNEFVLATMSDGDFFGEMSLLDGQPRSATIVALQDCSFAVLKREHFLKAIYEEPKIAVQLLSSVVKRLRSTDDMLGAMAFLDVSQRILKILSRIAHEKGEYDKASSMFKIKKIPHKELASMTGASREAVSKAIKILQFKSAIKEDEKFFYINPLAASSECTF